jgi:hypothetical protein
MVLFANPKINQMKSLLFVFILSVGLYPGNPSANNITKKAPAKGRVQDSKLKVKDSSVKTSDLKTGINK